MSQLGLSKAPAPKAKPAAKPLETSIQLAVAVYLCCYFDANKSSKRYYNAHQGCPEFMRFFQQDFSTQKQLNESFQGKLRQDFGLFKEVCCKAENGDAQMMDKLLSVKKFFAVPWLICGDTLVRNLN